MKTNVTCMSRCVDFLVVGHLFMSFPAEMKPPIMYNDKASPIRPREWWSRSTHPLVPNPPPIPGARTMKTGTIMMITVNRLRRTAAAISFQWTFGLRLTLDSYKATTRIARTTISKAVPAAFMKSTGMPLTFESRDPAVYLFYVVGQ
jgi:hypothetical protein